MDFFDFFPHERKAEVFKPIGEYEKNSATSKGSRFFSRKKLGAMSIHTGN